MTISQGLRQGYSLCTSVLADKNIIHGDCKEIWAVLEDGGAGVHQVHGLGRNYEKSVP